MMHKLQILYKLSPEERKLSLEAVLLLPLLAIRLKLLGFTPLARIPKPKSGLASPSPSTLAKAEKIASIVYRTANHLPFHSSCLVRSLALWRILQNHHIASELVIGVGKSADMQFAAHAWVEYQGVALAERQDIDTLYSRIMATNLDLKSLS
jgi:hypothetical protein